MISTSVIRENWRYDEITGKLWWKKRARGRQMNRPAGTHSGNYIRIWHCGRYHSAHQLIWTLKTGNWPKFEIDHRDGNGVNNCWFNLRRATRSQQTANAKKSQRNKSGFKGVYWQKQNQKWHVQIEHKGRKIHLGYFDDPKLAHQKYLQSAKQYFGNFARIA